MRHLVTYAISDVGQSQLEIKNEDSSEEDKTLVSKDIVDEEDKHGSKYNKVDKLSRQLLLERDGQRIQLSAIGFVKTHYFNDSGDNVEQPYMVLESEFDQPIFIKCDPSDKNSWIFDTISTSKDIEKFIGQTFDCKILTDSVLEINDTEIDYVRGKDLKKKSIRNASNKEILDRLSNRTATVEENLYKKDYKETYLMLEYGNIGISTHVDVELVGDKVYVYPKTKDCDAQFKVTVYDGGTWDEENEFCRLVDSAGGFDYIEDTEYYLYKKEDYKGTLDNIITHSSDWYLLKNPYEKKATKHSIDKFLDNYKYEALFASGMIVTLSAIGGIAGFFTSLIISFLLASNTYHSSK